MSFNMHWLKYIRCKISIQQALTFRGLFVSLSSQSVYENDFFVNFTDCFVPLLLEPAASFPRSLCNVFLRTETRPVTEKQIGRGRRKAMVTEKVTGMLLQNLDENTNTQNGNTENDSQEIWPKETILRILGLICYRKT